MKLILSGSVGTGKTTVADILGKRLDLEVIHVNDLIKTSKEINPDAVDLGKLHKLLKGKDEVILESHLLCEIPLDEKIIILRCNPEIIRERLKSRDYSPEKIKENLDAEAIDYCVQMAQNNYEKIIQVDTTNLSPEQVCDKIILYLEKDKSDNPDFSNFFIE